MHQNKVPLKNLTAVALPHLNPMIWPVVPESGTLFLPYAGVSAECVTHLRRAPQVSGLELGGPASDEMFHLQK